MKNEAESFPPGQEGNLLQSQPVPELLAGQLASVSKQLQIEPVGKALPFWSENPLFFSSLKPKLASKHTCAYFCTVQCLQLVPEDGGLFLFPHPGGHTILSPGIATPAAGKLLSEPICDI